MTEYAEVKRLSDALFAMLDRDKLTVISPVEVAS